PARRGVYQQKCHGVHDGDRGKRKREPAEQVPTHSGGDPSWVPGLRPGTRDAQWSRICTRPNVPYHAAAAGGRRNPCTHGLTATITPRWYTGMAGSSVFRIPSADSYICFRLA